jgi:indole-3-glycerol phosphate synthase
MNKASILEKIALHKKNEVKAAKVESPIESFSYSKPCRDFIKPLTEDKINVIAEIKKASPSKGVIREDFRITELATQYESGGASCISVLTDVDFFQGSNDYLRLAKESCALPVLRKDFIVDDYQLYESKHLGADCILLIVAILTDEQLEAYCKLAIDMGMAVLVECHTEKEVYRALKLPTPLIGINNRSLHTFETKIDITIQLLPLIPRGKIIVSESGLDTREDLLLLREYHVNAFLIGESLMRENNPGLALNKMLTG